MAFMRYAKAMVAQPAVSGRGWSKVRTAAAAPSRNIMSQAAEILGSRLDPDKFLLTHSTIVASVDVEHVQGVKLGKVKIGNSGRTINRKYADYHIKPECSNLVNNNGDSWSRAVLQASYPTFIGGHNFLEHVQIEEQSKGRIIDAVARDIGHSVYIDILVATARRHEQLILDIKSGKMATLSMGCSVEETICTKCGNVAVDEVDLCPCIKYEKLNKFIDAAGQSRIVAELCGHPDIEDNAGVHFIEASWVATPAFEGAVLRNILDIDHMDAAHRRQLQAALNTLPPQWDGAHRVKAAAFRAGFDFGEDEGEDEISNEAPEAEAPANPLDDAAKEVEDEVRERAVQKIKDQLQKDDVEDALNSTESTMAPNDSIIKEGYTGAVKALMRTASSEVDFIDKFATVNQAFGVAVPRHIYRAAVKVGSVGNYPSMSHFLKACHHVVGREVSPADIRVMVRIGNLLSRLGGNPHPQGVQNG